MRDPDPTVTNTPAPEPSSSAPRPALTGLHRVTATTRHTVLVLHGGQEESTESVPWWRAPVLRMIPFARAIAAAVGPDVPVLRLRYRVRGWNAPAQDPVVDARWALDEITARAPEARVVLVGHSMGGRVALRLLGDPRVDGLVGLAPWVTPRDRAEGRAGQRALLIHGAEDIVTDPRGTARMARDLTARGVEVDLEIVRGENHALLKDARRWHQATAAFVHTLISDPPH